MSRGNSDQSLSVVLASDHASVPVALASGHPDISVVTEQGPVVLTPTGFTRPADTTAYAVGDLIANSTTAGSVTPITISGAARAVDEPVMFRRVRISTDDTAWAAASATIRVHLFRASPVPVNGDNGAFSVPRTGYVGYFDVLMDRAFSDGSGGAGAPAVGSEITTMPATGTDTYYALLEERTAVTPGSGKAFSLILEALRG